MAMAMKGTQQTHLDLNGDFATENIFDLRAEYAETAVQLALKAQERDCLLSLSIAPHTPRFFLGEPQPIREILLSLVESSLQHQDVEIVNVRLGSLGNGLDGRHRLEIMVASNGSAQLPRQMSLFEPLRKPRYLPNSYIAQQNNRTLNRINELLRLLGGSLRVDDVYGRGPRYVARFNLTRVVAAEAAG